MFRNSINELRSLLCRVNNPHAQQFVCDATPMWSMYEQRAMWKRISRFRSIHYHHEQSVIFIFIFHHHIQSLIKEFIHLLIFAAFSCSQMTLLGYIRVGFPYPKQEVWGPLSVKTASPKATGTQFQDDVHETDYNTKCSIQVQHDSSESMSRAKVRILLQCYLAFHLDD